ncbi:MAG: YggS family pyridoxal phosphate-dependent enzyme [Anaeroplasmataceae bacterium]|jgi:pyridoxal phosphate enzyme, YggS family|nr:YggS family pyridoxal phosphate-dependent enzyme [Anaeroplasmataceae bacterium]
MELAKNIKTILHSIPNTVQLVAATKYVEVEDMLKLLKEGIYHFGENRTDAFLKKYAQLKAYPIRWHFIGHLQTNKAKEVLPKLDVLHSLDSLKLAREIEKYREEVLPCFIEVNINGEQNKNGISPLECVAFIEELKKYPKVKVIGLMMMTTKLSTKEEKLRQFQSLAKLLEEINARLNMSLKELSMGMSEDYLEAIEANSTTIRLGRILWEIRN